MGIILGVAAGFFFAAGAIFIRLGMRTRLGDDGLLMTVLVNVVILGVASVFASWPALDGWGFLALVAGGVIGTVLGRAANLRAIRRIGPTRTSAFLTGNPVVAAAVGWSVLGEAVTVPEALGGLLVLVGLGWLARSGTTLPILLRSDSSGEPVDGETSDAPGGGSGYLYAALAPVLFGVAFVVRKWGLERFPGAVTGAFIGSAAALVVVVAGNFATGRLDDRIQHNFRRVPWMFVAAGTCTSLALLCQFLAFSRAPAWIVGLLHGTQTLWTIALSFVFLRQEELIDRQLIWSIVLVVVGIGVIGLQV